MSEKLSEHELFAWVGNHGYDFKRPGYPQALSLDLKIMLETQETEFVLLRRRYNELIYAVATCFENETRHETALRYISERENRPSEGPASAEPTKEQE